VSSESEIEESRAVWLLRSMRKSLSMVAAAIVLTQLPPAFAAGFETAWTITLNPSNFILGPALQQLHTRRSWAAGFNDQAGDFEIALRKTAVAIPAPKCRMDYLILEIPTYYPENPKRASPGERRTVYDALLRIQERDGGSMTARVEAPLGLARKSAARAELVACNLYFALPLSVQVSEP
jgi:hypothetical protein